LQGKEILKMHVGTTNIVIAVACFILIILLALVYSRSRRGDQRIVRAIEQTFLPLLSALLITLGVLFNTQSALACTGAAGNLKYVAVFGAVLLIVIGIIRYLLSRQRDRRVISHAVLFAIMLVLAVFLIVEVIGCA
jgi:cytochrome bd-type quinol oxidase subunit 2